MLPASAVHWLVVQVVEARRGRLSWWSRPRTGLRGLFMQTVTPVSVNVVAVLWLVDADVGPRCPRRGSGGQPAGWPRGLGRGSGSVLGWGGLSLACARSAGEGWKGLDGQRGGELAVATGYVQSQRFLCAAGT